MKERIKERENERMKERVNGRKYNVKTGRIKGTVNKREREGEKER